VIRLHVEDNDENEAPEKEEPTKRIATPHLRNLAEGGKQLLMLISPQEDRTNTSVAERRLRIRPKHTAICTSALPVPANALSTSLSDVLPYHSHGLSRAVAVTEEANTGNVILWHHTRMGSVLSELPYWADSSFTCVYVL